MIKLTKKEPKQELTLADLEELLGSKERVLFYLAWLKHDRNATKAYMELHPNASYDSARVLGSTSLAKINIELIANAYGLDRNLYFQQLYDGLKADKWNDFTGDREPDHKTRKPYHDKLGKILGIESGDGEWDGEMSFKWKRKE